MTTAAMETSNNSYTEVLGMQLARKLGQPTTFAGTAAAVQQEEHRVAARGVVAVGQQHVDAWQPADRRRGQLVVLHAAVVLVLGHGEGSLGRGRSGDDGAAPDDGGGGETTHPLEQGSAAEPMGAGAAGLEVGWRVGGRGLCTERHGMSLDVDGDGYGGADLPPRGPAG